MPTRQMACPRCWGSRTATFCSRCGGDGRADDEQLSDHFWLSEFLASDTAVRRGFANDPTPAQLANLRRLAVELAEPMRAEFGPYAISSGLRVPALNAAIGGSSSTSAHPTGNAFDGRPVDRSIRLGDVVAWVAASKLPFDQVIYEGTWVHVGRVSPTGTMRRQVLQMFQVNGRPTYSRFDPTDPRVL